MRFWLNLCLLLCTVTAARAQEPVTLSLGGETLLVFRVTEFGRSPQERADQVEDRLRTILSEPIRPDDVTVHAFGAAAAQIYVKDQLLVTLGPKEAKASRSRALPLARVWVKRLQRILPRVSARRTPSVRRR